MPAHAFTILEAASLPAGYCELTLQSEHELAPSPGPGQYLSAVLSPGAPLTYSPVIKVQAPDKFQVLSRTQIARGTRIQNAHIEGDTPAPDPAYPELVLVSGNIALGCSIFAASRLRTQGQYKITVFAHFDTAAPFKPTPSQILMPACPPEVIAAVPLLDSWNIPSRLASPLEQHGFYHGDISALLELWWQQLTTRSRLQILGFGEDRFLHGLREWCQVRRTRLRTAVIPAAGN